MIYLYLILFASFITSAFTKTGKKYVKLTGIILVLFSCVLGVHSIFFQDKVKNATPIGEVSSESTDLELGSVYSVEGVIEEMYSYTEYTNTKPQEVRVLRVNGVVCKLCPCEDEYLMKDDEVRLKGRLVGTGDFNLLKGCYIIEVK